MDHAVERGVGEAGGVLPAEVTEEQCRRAIALAEAYVRSAEEARERAREAAQAAVGRLRSCEHTLRIGLQALARIQMLGRQFERN